MKQKSILGVLALATLVAMTTAGWSVLAGSDWPPEPYHMYSPEGTWLETGTSGIPGDVAVATLSPVDPATGMGSGVKTHINVDPTCGGQIPEATSWSPWFLTTVRVGPDTGRIKAICYVKKDDKPMPRILMTMITECASTITASGVMTYEGTWSFYGPAADQDGDGLPDPGQPPLTSFPITGRLTRL